MNHDCHVVVIPVRGGELTQHCIGDRAFLDDLGVDLDPAGPRGIYGFPAVRGRANEVGHRSVAIPGDSATLLGCGW